MKEKSVPSPSFPGHILSSLGLLCLLESWLSCSQSLASSPSLYISETRWSLGACWCWTAAPTPQLGFCRACLVPWKAAGFVELIPRVVLGHRCHLPWWRARGPSCLESLVPRCWEKWRFLCGAQLLGLLEQLKGRLGSPSSPAVVLSSLWEGSQLLKVTT